MSKTPSKGDKVTWNTPQGKTKGTVQKVVTGDTKVGSHKVKASKNDPQVVVRSDKSGKQAAHKPGSLKKS